VTREPRSSPSTDGDTASTDATAPGAGDLRSEDDPRFPRCSGILAHPTSLPGPYGIGDVGPGARRFVDWLVDAGQSLWQVLPLGPTSFGDSPYQTLSAFAGNPLLISPDDLLERGWLDVDDLNDRPELPEGWVDFGRVIPFKESLLRRAWHRFGERATDSDRQAFAAWCAEHAAWLDDFALFGALKERETTLWMQWPRALALREPEALRTAADELADQIAQQRFRQWLFFDQWARLRSYAAARGVRLFGDVPIFVALDSADVWSHRDLFRLDARGRPEVVAGVPPDYFSETGQLWGNPLYDWERMEENGFAWWGDRIAASLEMVDILRIDHFRGFEAYWEVPADAKTAVKGRWQPGPRDALFRALEARFGDLPIVAEDLGVITPPVEALRDRFRLPGMKVLQFAWGDPRSPYLPHNMRRNGVVYAGTHDNPTTRTWWDEELDDGARHLLREYLGLRDGDGDQEPNWLLIRLGMMSVAHTFVATLQDVLGLGADARMNTPGREAGNWGWRVGGDLFTHPARDRLKRLAWLYERAPEQRRAGVPTSGATFGATTGATTAATSGAMSDTPAAPSRPDEGAR